MGTKVQCKSYLPGYHPTRDVNEDANFNWSPFGEDKTFSRHLYKNFKPQGFSSWPEYDKETMKRTMLQHEALFRNQVNELHRLYRIQKELMHELQRKQLNRFYGPMETSRSSAYRSQVHPEFDEKIWQPPLASTCRGTTNRIDSRDKRAALSATQFVNGGYVKNDELGDIEIKKFPKRILDLHLPADAYIEEEDSEKTEGETVANVADALNTIHDIEADNDVKLTLGGVEVAGFVKSTVKSNLHLRNSLSAHRLADLNMPFKDSSEDGDGGSCTHKFSGVYELPEGDQQPWTPIRSNTSSPQTNIFKEKVESSQEWRLLHNCSVQSKVAVDSLSSALFIDKCPMSSESVKLKLENARESQLPDQNQTKTWFQEKATHSTPIFGSEASQVTSSLSVVPSLFYAVGSAASWTKPTKILDHIPAAVQALPCFGTASMLNGQSKSYVAFKQRNDTDDDKLHCNGYKHLQERFDDKPSSRANDHHHSIQVNSLYGIHEPKKCLKGLDFVDIKSAKELSLSQGTDNEAPKGLVWLQESSACNGYANKKECSTQVDSRSSKDYSQLFAEFYGSSICSSKHSVSSFDAKESKIRKDVIPDSLESGGIFSIPCNSRRNFHCSNSVPFDEESSADYAKGFINCRSGLKKDIDLNSELMPVTDNKPIGVSPRVARKRMHEIDLEAPADEVEEDDTFSDTEVVDINRPRIMVEASQEKISSEDIHLRSAADAIVSISMDVHSQLSKVTSYPLSPSSCDSLHLLAEVVAQGAESCGVSEDDGLDAFESMTLKLEEIKPDEYCFQPHQEEKPKGDDKSAASMLLSRPRRGQARKRRQKRDFQKDVLPALASLSRYEVTEDLQALGGITRAGKSRQTSSTRMGSRQNQSTSQTRGKRRPRSPAIVIAQACDSHPQEQPIHAELENNGANIMTWGRTTRRCPRQRVPITGNASAPQST